MFHRTIYSVLIGMLAALGPVGCNGAEEHGGSAALQQTCQARRKGGKPTPMNPEAKATMKRFQRALAACDWQRALDCCCPQVRSGASQYASTEEFLRAAVPIERITLLTKQLSICSHRTFPGDPGREGSFYESFVTLLEGGGELNVSWTWKVEKTAQGWQIVFPTIPLDQWIQQEVARLHAREEEYRDAQIRLLTHIRGISTRLTVLGNRFRLGKPMPLRLELVNQSRLELMYDDQQVDVNDSLRVTDTQEREIPYVAGSFQTGGAYTKLRPGETVVLFDRLDVAKQYAIKQLGHYSVQYRGHGLHIGVEDPDLKHRSENIVDIPCENIVGIPCQWPSNVVTIEVTR